MLRRLFLIIFNFFFLAVTGNNIQYGLTFRSHSVNQDLRTSLNLTPDAPLSLPDGFSLEFAIKFKPGIQTYGYVCRVISNDKQTFDIISNINARKLNCVLMDGDNASSNVDFKIAGPDEPVNWNKIKIHFQSGEINCYINEEIHTIPYSFNSFNKIKIYFGKNWDPGYYTADVPPIIVKDVTIRNEKGEALYSWEMDKYLEDEVFDSVRGKRAVVENGDWDIDKYIKWNKEASVPITEKYPQFAFDSIKKIFYIATADSVVSFDLYTHEVERVKTAAGSPFAAGTSSQMIYDPIQNRLISYDLVYHDFIIYDFDRNTWSGDKLDQRFAPAHQHNRFVDLKKNRLVTFGGYGYQTYKAWLSFHSLDGGEWDINDLSDQIAPRYLSALGYRGDGKFLLLGGYGSLSGKQEESPRNFYDLYEIDSYNLTCRKLFDLTVPIQPIVFSNSMIIDEETQKIYALAFDNMRFHSQLRLCEISLVDGKVTLLADCIPYNFVDMDAFCDLILDKEKAALYAVLLQKNDKENAMDVYSLSYPPLRVEDVVQKVPKVEDQSKLPIVLYVIVLIGVVGIGILFLYRRKKNIVSLLKEDNIQIRTEDHSDAIPSPELKISSTIKLIGGFQVFDKEGEDITDSFTQILKHIFLFILLSSIRDGKKITSDKLDETFWFEMDKASAANNRSVNVRKLRLLLEKVGNIVLSNKRSYWHIDVEEDVNCDYKTIMTLLKQVKENEALLNQRVVEQIVDIAKNGTLLPNLNIEWVDAYKSEYSSILIEVLSKAVTLSEINTNLKLLVKIANVMLLHDNIDEEAIGIKCRALFMLGQKGSSKQCFDKFIQDYERLLGETPKISYEDIIHT